MEEGTKHLFLSIFLSYTWQITKVERPMCLPNCDDSVFFYRLCVFPFDFARKMVVLMLQTKWFEESNKFVWKWQEVVEKMKINKIKSLFSKQWTFFLTLSLHVSLNCKLPLPPCWRFLNKTRPSGAFKQSMRIRRKEKNKSRFYWWQYHLHELRICMFEELQ